MKKYLKIIISIFLILSVLLNVNLAYRYYELIVIFRDEAPHFISFDDANSRDTIFSIHNIKQAQEISQGEGIKVGILDSAFNYNKYKTLYSDAVDFLNNPDLLNKLEGHGFWMATVLREVAPKCEIYALNTLAMDDDEKEIAMIKAIDWAIENDIDILTYSSSTISEKNLKQFNEAVRKAHDSGIVTTFIHYPFETNLLPYGMLPYREFDVARMGDINVFHYDYNSFEVGMYEKYQNAVLSGKALESMPFLSISSTSPITAGFVAILKSVNNDLSPQDYKDILIKTSYSMQYNGKYDFEKDVECPRVVDLFKAVKYLEENY